MRIPEYLSPTSISLFYENQNDFYLNYLADNRPPRSPQTQPMSVGSAFDAYAKSHLYEGLFGKSHNPKYDLRALFEAQVEPHNRDWAWKAGAYAFMEYKSSGAYADLMLELQSSISTPKFEIEVRGTIDGYREGVTRNIGPVTFLGKPDVFFINKHAAHVVLDWKVNGFCSKYNTSPMQGYVRLRKDGRNAGQHKSAQIMMVNGMMLNISGALEDYEKDWARQLSIYGWLCGLEVGSDFIVAIDQLTCKPGCMADMPDIRVAEHRLKVRIPHQWKIFAEAQYVWEVVHSNHIFRDLTLEESQRRCEILDGTAEALCGKGSEADIVFARMTRG